MAEKKEYQVTDYAGKLAKGFLRNPLTPLLGIFLLVYDPIFPIFLGHVPGQ
jgi:hypothetical protein